MRREGQRGINQENREEKGRSEKELVGYTVRKEGGCCCFQRGLIDKVTPGTASSACGVKERTNSVAPLKQLSLSLSSFGSQVSKLLLINA